MTVADIAGMMDVSAVQAQSTRADIEAVCALARDARDARDFTAHFLDEKFGRFDRQAGKWRPTHHHVRLDGALSPRTLKLAATAQEEWLLGLCRFEECPR